MKRATRKSLRPRQINSIKILEIPAKITALSKNVSKIDGSRVDRQANSTNLTV